jgi:hypothetical protein
MRNALLAYTTIAALSAVGCGKSSPGETGAAPAPSAAAADSASAAAAAAAPAAAGSLPDMLSSQFGLSPDQAKAGVGAILSYAEGALPAADFQKIAAAIPGAGDHIQAAKDAGGVTGPITDAAGLNAAFGKIGISPEIASGFTSTVTDYVGKVAGPEAGNLLKGLFP